MSRRSFFRLPKIFRFIPLIILVLWISRDPQGFIQKIAAALPSENVSVDNSSQVKSSSRQYRIVKVIDGDTLLLEGNKKVRLIGVDTPEKYESVKLYRDAIRTKNDVKVIQSLGQEASVFVKDLLQSEKVRLEYGDERKDDYGRTLAYVYFTMPEKEFFKRVKDSSSGSLDPKEYMLNRVLIEYGYAHAYTKFPFKYREEFIKIERVAREEGKGLWSESSE